jgi:hypothetical protein
MDHSFLSFTTHRRRVQTAKWRSRRGSECPQAMPMILKNRSPLRINAPKSVKRADEYVIEPSSSHRQNFSCIDDIYKQ